MDEFDLTRSPGGAESEDEVFESPMRGRVMSTQLNRRAGGLRRKDLNMKPSGLIHVISVVIGIVGVVVFVASGVVSVRGGADGFVLGVSQTHALLCVVVLILIATWLQVATIHHVMLERMGQKT